MRILGFTLLTLALAACGDDGTTPPDASPDANGMMDSGRDTGTGADAAADTSGDTSGDAAQPMDGAMDAAQSDAAASDGATADGAASDSSVDAGVDAGLTCTGCHGAGDSPNPPPDLAGNTATTFVTVGAHETHLAGGVRSAPVACNACHVVPANIGDPGHMDAAPAEVTFSGVAVTGGATPTWDRNAETCSNVYCHGATLSSGGTLTTPQWTQVDGSQNACGTCHSLPPSAPHPGSASCENCHSSVVAAGPVIIDRSLHVNGTVDF